MATNCIIALMSNGMLIRTYTNSLYNPQGLTFSADGNLLLSDALDSRRVLFPLLIVPRLITVESNGNIYVNSLNNDRAYNIIKKLTIKASYTIPPSALTEWNPYVSVINETHHYLIVAESGGRILFVDL